MASANSGIARAIPLILCGRTEKVGKAVIEGLKPEYEVIRFILSPEEAIGEIPALLSSSTDVDVDGHGSPSTDSSGVIQHPGSKAKAMAVIFGAGYTDENIASFREACYSPSSSSAGDKDQTQARKVPWLRPDTTKPAPPYGPEYGPAMVSRVRAALDELKRTGKWEGNGEIVWF